MLYNLRAEMLRKKIKNKEVAEAISVSEKTFYNKAEGITRFAISEALAIRDTFFPGMELDYLFASDDQGDPDDDPDQKTG